MEYLRLHCVCLEGKVACEGSHIFGRVERRTPGGVLAEKLGRGVGPASQNPYPIYDQNLRFSLPFGAAHTYIAHIREYPLREKNQPETRLRWQG